MFKFSQDQLNEITQQTLEHYKHNAKEFWEGTCDHDVSQNYSEFLKAMPDDSPLDIIDLGCGPGRDVLYFKNLGHNVVGIDGCKQFVLMARELTGAEIWHQNFLELNLPNSKFHGIFANASIFHIPSQELSRVLAELNNALRPGGILFMSNPRGEFEGFNGQRFGNYLEFGPMKEFIKGAGFEVLHHYYRPVGRPRNEQPWLAMVSQKVGSPSE